MKRVWTILVVAMVTAFPLAAQQRIEQIVARVNGDVILKSDVDREIEMRRAEMQQSGLDAARMEKEMAEQSKMVVRDLIDRALLLQIAKEAGLNADQDVEKTLEDLRVERKFATREDLEKAITRVTRQHGATETGEVLGFVGAKGGVGTTTVAVNIEAVSASP